MVTIVFTEAHVTRHESGPDTIELVGTCGDKPVALSAVEPRGSGEAFVRALGFTGDFTLNEPVEYKMKAGRMGVVVTAHRVDANGKKFRKDRHNGADIETEVG